MTLARFEANITDQYGNILTDASVEVRNESTGLLATLYSDRAGTIAIDNPLTSDANGFVYFHVVGGAYKIIVRKNDLLVTRRYVPIGTAQEADKNLVTLASDTFSDSGFVAVGGLNNYSEIEIQLKRVIPQTDNTDLVMLASVDGGSTYLAGTLNLYTLNRATSSTAALAGSTGTTSLLLASGLGTGTGEFYTGKIQLINHLDTSVYQAIIANGVMYDQAAAQRVADMRGVIKTAGPITNVAFLMSSGNINMSIKVLGAP